MTHTIPDILNKAADLLEPEGAWHQGEAAVDAGGAEVSPVAPEACAWCLCGALAKFAADDGQYTEARSFVRELLPDLSHYAPLVAWNDAPERTQAEVVAALRSAAIAASHQMGRDS